MASNYLEQMAHDKYFLSALCRDERLNSANRQGSLQLQELAHKALADVEKRQVRDFFTKLDSQTIIIMGIKSQFYRYSRIQYLSFGYQNILVYKKSDRLTDWYIKA